VISHQRENTGWWLRQTCPKNL